MENASLPRKSRRGLALRAAMLLVLAAGIAAALALDPQAAWAEVHQQRFAIKAWVEDNRALAVAAYLGIYVGGVALSVPGAVAMTVLGGFLFGTLAGAALAGLAATTGATAIFVAARFIVGDALRRRMGPFLSRLEAGFRRHAFNYLVVLRILPVFPFWVVNLVPAFAGVPLRTYVLGTLVGVVPGTLVFASLGAGLADAIDAEAALGPGLVLRPGILVPLAAMALLALAPVAYKRLRAGRESGA